ncbi:STAS domain-containing protein [Amycolatopsis sp. CA-230715]|uniref:STAS domain-containing protein n=1 Tax=Amycolatopsis sp. CA-230715 TaxID=2745196 RepID=UPI001C02107B|nr:STAS domain-containing protein [Amycolatopsis sp. CA-230715]
MLIAFRGDLDTATCPSARAAIEDALEVEVTRTLVLDFSRVHVFATAAAHLVNDVSTASERCGTDLRVVAGESRCIRRPLSMFGGGKTAMHDSRAAALRA